MTATCILYLNAYRVTRHYGGPEEGGWWFDAGEPLASVPFLCSVLRELPRDRDGGVIMDDVYAIESDDDDDGLPEGTMKLAHDTYVRVDQTFVATERQHLATLFSDVAHGSIGSVLGGAELRIALDHEPAASWPVERPRYE